VSATVSSPARDASASASRVLPGWWPLAALMVLAALLRFATLDLQSFWYDEAFTPVHVLHPSLWATLRAVVHSENSPPLWYLLAWADSRLLGTGEIALRLPSALAGLATVPVAWAIGRELAGRRTALACAALVAVNPLLVWYSQEARVYALFVLTVSLAMLCFLRALHEPTRRRMALFALSGALALLTHYFSVFLLVPMVLWLAFAPGPQRAATRRAALPAIGALAIVGVALLPLISAQGGHGTQWIGEWALSARLQAIPQYYLTGYSGAPLGRGIELLIALPILLGVGLGLWCMTGAPAQPARAEQHGLDAPARAADAEDDRDELARGPRGALIAVSIAAVGVLTPIVLIAFGADYLAPRNLVAAMIPVTALIAVMLAAPRSRERSASAVGVLLSSCLVLTFLAFLAISLDVDRSPRLQRGNWRGVAAALRSGSRARAITSVELGSAPLEYYMPHLHNLHPGSSVLVSEIDETGYSPLRRSAGEPPAPGFHLRARLNIDGLIVYRFVSARPLAVSEAALRRHVITLAHPEVLVPGGAALAP